MTAPLVVSIGELRRATNHALDLAEQRLGSEVDLGADFYWHLDVTKAFEIHDDAGPLTMGQLSDDLASVREDKTAAVPEEAWHELRHVAALLRGLERLAVV